MEKNRLSFCLAQLSVWNYNTESFWSELFGPAPAQPRSAKLLSEIWDQISLRYRPEDDRSGLVHLRLVGSTLGAFVHFDDARRRPAGDVRLVKFQPLADFRTSAPTELGLPARFKSTLAGVVSARGSVAGVASLASLKLSCEARVTLPFSAHYASAGVDLRVELRAPRHVTIAESLAWKPPDQDTDFAYFHVVPFTLTRSLADETVPPTEAHELRVVSSRGASRFTQHLGANFRFEVTSVAAPDASASVWLQRLIDADLSALSPRRLDHRVFRLRYLPDAPLDSVAVSASIETLRRDAGVDFISRLNDTAPIDAAAQLHRVTSRITTRYSNGTTNQWTPFEFEIERSDGPDEYVNVIASPISDFIRPWFNSVDRLLSKRLANIFLQSAISNVTGGPSSVQLEQYGPVGALLRGSTSKTCLVRLDAVTTYDGIEYDYNLNECHHILTADCSKSGARYAITGRSDPVHGVAVRVTLANDVIDLSSANVSINGVLLESNATRVRLRSGDNVMATLTRSDDEIHFRLLHEQIHVVLNESGVVIHAGDQLLGVACGLCGDGDGETGGEFKTADRCALSSGSLMAASFQVRQVRQVRSPLPFTNATN